MSTSSSMAGSRPLFVLPWTASITIRPRRRPFLARTPLAGWCGTSRGRITTSRSCSRTTSSGAVAGGPFGSAVTRHPTTSGSGHTADEVAAFDPVSAALLVEYHEAVDARTRDYLGALTDVDLDRVVDRRWDPPVTPGAAGGVPTARRSTWVSARRVGHRRHRVAIPRLRAHVAAGAPRRRPRRDVLRACEPTLLEWCASAQVQKVF